MRLYTLGIGSSEVPTDGVQEMHRRSQGRQPNNPTSIIFGVAFNPVNSTWSSFCENTLKVLSEHKSEAEAHAACRRYEAALLRRMDTQPFAGRRRPDRPALWRTRGAVHRGEEFEGGVRARGDDLEDIVSRSPTSSLT